MQDIDKFRADALEQVISWTSLAGDERDEFGAFRELAAIYKQAVLSPTQSLADALSKAMDDLTADSTESEE